MDSRHPYLALLLVAYASLCTAAFNGIAAEHPEALTDTYLDYQKALSGADLDLSLRPGRQRALATKRAELLKASRGGAAISREDYALLKGTSARTAAGAHWAHEIGIQGEGVTILLLENSGTNEHRVVDAWVEASSPKGAAHGHTQKQDHGASMAFLMHSVAPEAKVLLAHIPKFLDSSLLKGARIINASFGGDKENGFEELFGGIKGQNVLIIKSAGNHQQNLSQHSYTSGVAPELAAQSIFVGNLRQDYRMKTSSGTPGDNPKFNDNFLWVMADDVLSASGPRGSDQFSPTTGTSGAAATLSGAAALILSQYSGFTTAQLKEALLESADRDFMQLLGGHGHQGVHMRDPEQATIRAYAGWKKANAHSSALNFAQDLAQEKQGNLVAGIIGTGQGVGGLSKRSATRDERRQYEALIKNLLDNDAFNPLSLFSHMAQSEVEDIHRLHIWGIAQHLGSEKLAPWHGQFFYNSTIRMRLLYGAY